MQIWYNYFICSGRRCLSPSIAIFTLIARLTACCTCSFYCNSRLKITLRSFAVADGRIVLFCMTICPLLYSLFLLVKWISSVFFTAKQYSVRLIHASIREISFFWILLSRAERRISLDLSEYCGGEMADVIGLGLCIGVCLCQAIPPAPECRVWSLVSGQR